MTRYYRSREADPSGFEDILTQLNSSIKRFLKQTGLQYLLYFERFAIFTPFLEGTDQSSSFNLPIWSKLTVFVKDSRISKTQLNAYLLKIQRRDCPGFPVLHVLVKNAIHFDEFLFSDGGSYFAYLSSVWVHSWMILLIRTNFFSVRNRLFLSHGVLRVYLFWDLFSFWVVFFGDCVFLFDLVGESTHIINCTIL